MDCDVYFSGVSTSTKTSSIPQKSILQLDSESLEAQLDRLNSTLIGLLNNDEVEFCDSFSFQCSNDRDNSISSSYLPTEYSEKNPEQLLMTCEDFRSHEFRSLDQSLKKVSVECQLSDLYNLKSDLEKSIQLIEQGISKTVQLRAGELQFRLQVKNGFFLPGKKKIISNLADENVEKKEKAYVRQLENEVDELKYQVFHSNTLGELDQLMMKSFNDQFAVQEFRQGKSVCEVCKDLASHTSLEIETKLAGKMNLARKKMLEELEWEVSNTKMMKSVYEGKVQDLKEVERKTARQIQEINKEVVKKCKGLEHDKMKFVREQERFKNHQQNLKVAVDQVKAELESIKENVEKIEVQALTIQIPTPCTTPKHDSDTEEISALESEMKKLEQELQTSSDKGSIEFKMNKIKTKLSTLRSAKILETCTNKRRVSSFIRPKDLASTTPKVSKAFNFNIPIEAIKITPRGDARTMTAFSERPKEFSVEASPLQTSRQSEELTKEENFFKTLELKEARLRKKEEEIMRQELKLQQNWMKLPDANQLIPIVRNEIERYMAQNENLKKTQTELDNLLKDQINFWKKSKAAEAESAKTQENLSKKLKSAEKIQEVLTRLDQVLN